MRITPLAVWSRKLNLAELERVIEIDVSMMHSNSAMWNICTAYCIAIRDLLLNFDNPERATLALNSVREYSEIEGKTELIGQYLN